MSNFKKSFTKDFTVMPNEIFRHGLTLQAIGLYSFLIGRPETWEFSIAGLEACLDEGRDKIRAAVNCLEDKGFLHREQLKKRGQFSVSVWTIFDTPLKEGKRSKPIQEETMLVNPILENTTTVKPTQLNTDLINKELVNKEGSTTPEEKIKNEKKKFFTIVKTWKLRNPGKYPSQLYKNFFDYWTESDEIKGTGKMRFQDQKHFEIGRRLSTFWNYVKDNEKSEMWKAEDNIKPIVELSFESKTID